MTKFKTGKKKYQKFDFRMEAKIRGSSNMLLDHCYTVRPYKKNPGSQTPPRAQNSSR